MLHGVTGAGVDDVAMASPAHDKEFAVVARGRDCAVLQLNVCLWLSCDGVGSFDGDCPRSTCRTATLTANLAAKLYQKVDDADAVQYYSHLVHGEAFCDAGKIDTEPVPLLPQRLRNAPPFKPGMADLSPSYCNSAGGRNAQGGPRRAEAPEVDQRTDGGIERASGQSCHCQCGRRDLESAGRDRDPTIGHGAVKARHLRVRPIGRHGGVDLLKRVTQHVADHARAEAGRKSWNGHAVRGSHNRSAKDNGSFGRFDAVDQRWHRGCADRASGGGQHRSARVLPCHLASPKSSNRTFSGGTPRSSSMRTTALVIIGGPHT